MNLIIEGGGIKGIAIIGALYYLEVEGYTCNSFENFAGSSIGSVICLLYIIGLSPLEIFHIIYNIDFGKIFYNNFPVISLFNSYGILSKNKFMNILSELLEKKNISKNITFLDLYNLTNKVFVVTGTSLSSRDTYYFNKDTSPQMPVLDAIKISISIPGVMTAEPYKIGNETHIFVDGGVLMNFPYYYFELSKKNNKMFYNYKDTFNKINSIDFSISSLDLEYKDTIGIKILEKNSLKTDDGQFYYNGFNTINNIFSFFSNLVSTITTKIEILNLYNNSNEINWDRIITIENIDNAISATKFNLTDEEKISLFNVGVQSCYNFFN